LLERQRDMGRRTLGKVSGIDPGLVHTVQRCLETDPQRRPQTAEELRKDLAACLSSFRRAARWVRSHPRIVALLAVGAMAVLVCASILVFSRKPYGERQFLRGLAYYEAGDFPEAVRYFNLAVDAAPEKAAWWYARGRARQRNGDYAEAIEDYWKAHRLSNDSRCLAAIAYCRTRTDWTSAIKAYRDTVAAGRGDALVYAGLGYCQFQLNEYGEAKQSLDTALMQDPDLAVAYYCRAVNESRQSLLEQRPIEPRAVSDITEAMTRGVTGTRVLHSAALILNRYMRDEPRDVWRSKIFEILTKAVSEGMNRQSLLTLLEKLGLSGDDRATALLERAQVGQRASRNPSELLDPLPDLPQLLLTP
jgi:tetratricopeptide (TPR) repeat protein